MEKNNKSCRNIAHNDNVYSTDVVELAGERDRIKKKLKKKKAALILPEKSNSWYGTARGKISELQ